MERTHPLASLGTEQVESLVTVLDAVRVGSATTRPRGSTPDRTGPQRRNATGQPAGVLRAAGRGKSRSLHRWPGTAGTAVPCGGGVLLVAELGATSIEVALSDLAGELTHTHRRGGRRHRGARTGPQPGGRTVPRDRQRSPRRHGRMGGRPGSARSGRVQDRDAGVPTDHAGVGRVQRTRLLRLTFPCTGVGRQRRERDGPR